MAKIKTPGELRAALHRENAVLLVNIGKLKDFAASEEAEDMVNEEHMELMKRQLEVMREYSKILDKRIMLVKGM